MSRVEAEVALMRAARWEAVIGPGEAWVMVEGVALPGGWNQSSTDVLIKIPPGYPTTPPDNFFTDGGLRLANGAKPGNTAQEETIAGRSWLTFSYHIDGGWEADAEPSDGHNLMTYLAAVCRRLEEAN